MRGRYRDLVDADYRAARELFLEALRRSCGNVSEAARLLGCTYMVATRYLKRLGLWNEVDRLRRAFARQNMILPSTTIPEAKLRRGPARTHSVDDLDPMKSFKRR